MDLTKMFFNAYAGNSEINLKSSLSSAGTKKQSSDSFESYLDKAGDKTTTSKTDSKKTTKAQSNESKFNNGQSKEVKKPDDNDTVNAAQQNKDSDKEKTVSKEEKKTKTETKASEDNLANAEKIDNVQKVNEEIVKVIAAQTGLSEEEINAALESANLQAVDLADANNLLKFMMALTDVENPIDLISVDGVKDIMTEIKNVFEGSEKFTEFADKQIKLELQSDNPHKQEIKTDVVRENLTDSNAVNVKVSTDETVQVVTSEEVDLVEISLKNKTEKTPSSDERFVYQETENTESLNSVAAAAESSRGNNAGDLFSQNQGFLAKGENSQVSVSGVVMDNITKAFNEAVLRTESTRNVDTAEVVKQIIDKVKVGINKDVTEIKLSLKPEELGDVTVKVASHNGVVTAQITAESQRVKEIIEAGFNQLKQALSEAGVEVSELEVNVGSSDQDADFQNQYGSNEKTSSRISQIIEQDEAKEEISYIKENEVVGANVNYTA